MHQCCPLIFTQVRDQITSHQHNSFRWQKLVEEGYHHIGICTCWVLLVISEECQSLKYTNVKDIFYKALTNDFSWCCETSTKWFGAWPLGTGKMNMGAPFPLDMSSVYCPWVRTVEASQPLAWWYSFHIIEHVSAFSFSNADIFTISLSFLGHGQVKLNYLNCALNICCW